MQYLGTASKMTEWTVCFQGKSFNMTVIQAYVPNTERLLVMEKARGFQKNICFCFTDYAKVFDYVYHNKLWKILKEMGVPDHLTVSWETCMQIKKQQLEPCVEQLICSKSGKECDRAVYCHLAYLTDMRSTSCKMLGWIYHKLESRLPGEILITLKNN